MITKEQSIYLRSGILEHWHGKTLKDFTNCPKAKRNVENYIKQSEEALKDGAGFFLWGANGSGKSHLMACAFKELIAKKYKVQIITLSTLITKFTGGWYDSEQRKDLYDNMCNVDFLGIEEIGKEFKSATDLGSTVLDSILKYRVQRNLPVWATSNISPDKMSGYYTEDIASMMKQCSLALQVTGKDFRDEIKAALKKKYIVD